MQKTSPLSQVQRKQCFLQIDEYALILASFYNLSSRCINLGTKWVKNIKKALDKSSKAIDLLRFFFKHVI